MEFINYLLIIIRIAAQTGSASALGVGGCWFESNLSDKWVRAA